MIKLKFKKYRNINYLSGDSEAFLWILHMLLLITSYSIVNFLQFFVRDAVNDGKEVEGILIISRPPPFSLRLITREARNCEGRAIMKQ